MMEELYQELSQKVVDLLKDKNGRIIVGLAGPPGAGKTTTALKICEKVNDLLGLGSSIVVPMDGYHIPRAQLRQMENSEYLFKRRGAPFTFNPEALLSLVIKLKANNDVVKAPSFDHSLKDPVEDDIVIPLSAKIIIIEGNYLLLKDSIWCEISQQLDQKWIITADWDVIKERLIKRHLEAGICSTPDEALARAEENDIPNGHYIIDNSVKPDFAIKGDQ